MKNNFEKFSAEKYLESFESTYDLDERTRKLVELAFNAGSLNTLQQYGEMFLDQNDIVTDKNAIDQIVTRIKIQEIFLKRVLTLSIELWDLKRNDHNQD